MVVYQSTDPKFFLDHIDTTRSDAQKALNKNQQAEMGQFFTPPSVAKMMAEMYTSFPTFISLLDPGAGVGTLTAAFVTYVVQSAKKPLKIKSTVFEIDHSLYADLRTTLYKCEELCKKFGIEFTFEIKQQDFISSSVDILQGQNSLFPVEQPDYNFVILNPPYKKISSSSKTRHLLKTVGIETTNMYSAFLWLSMKLLAANGEMVAIVPRSFCNGSYFRAFRSSLLKTMRINKIHIYESRDKAFEEGDVLQENIIFHATKVTEAQYPVIISSSHDPKDENIVIRSINFDQLVYPNDPNLFIRIVPDQIGNKISEQVNSLISSLKDLGITVSTGKVVDFRARNLLRNQPDVETIPLIYPMNLKDGFIKWPINNDKKAAYLAVSKETDNLVVPSQYYVFVKRFSSKEEKRRVYAAVYNPEHIFVKRIGIENHINYFHKRYGGLSLELSKGLAAYLNSTLVDQYFRQFSGHTQVNATDLRSIKYPTEKQLIALGKRIGNQYPDQNEIDRLVTEELALNNITDENNIDDPIMAKRKIREALNILQLLSVPKAQQNDRSALTLLALTDMKTHLQWSSARENLVGITEMMDFFRDNYGISYAPNTRETVRRQTIHQFIQLGLVIANPDDPTRPINSPRTRYVIENKTLTLIKSFGSEDWEGNLHQYLRESTSLNRLGVKERAMPMIPVSLPNGERLMLSSGGQNTLIKSIIEEFCPRFTPGGKVVYIGDAGEKLTEKELRYFELLGIRIDKHGKMPDVIVTLPEKKWLVLIEAVTSHGPINIKRHNELKGVFSGETYGLVFVTAFETRKAMLKFLSEIAWETEVWVSESPSHLIHFNGERFLGPYANSNPE